MYTVIEKFVSIDGEGITAGELAVFIRFADCNLRCSWCDTRYSWENCEKAESLSKEEIFSYIKESKVRNVTLTGGEPLLVPQIEDLLVLLHGDSSLKIHIETNGSVALKEFKNKFANIEFVVDYKLPLSGMTSHMCHENMSCVTGKDVYKFVIAGKEDLEMAHKIILDNKLSERCNIHFSPVIGSIEICKIVDFMKENNLVDVRLQLQLHKFIWSKDTRGV